MGFVLFFKREREGSFSLLFNKPILPIYSMWKLTSLIELFLYFFPHGCIAVVLPAWRIDLPVMEMEDESVKVVAVTGTSMFLILDTNSFGMAFLWATYNF